MPSRGTVSHIAVIGIQFDQCRFVFVSSNCPSNTAHLIQTVGKHFQVFVTECFMPCSSVPIIPTGPCGIANLTGVRHPHINAIDVAKMIVAVLIVITFLSIRVLVVDTDITDSNFVINVVEVSADIKRT